MSFYADLHVHSRYSRATSRTCDLEHLAWWAARKGIAVVGTGDFTHPAWFAELEEGLAPAEPGLFRLRPDLEQSVLDRLPASCRRPVRFLLSVEISTIYKWGDRTRKVHHLVYAPDLATARACNERLGRVGNLGSDGRPILGLDSRDLLEIVLESGEGAYLVPAHVWTPWFAVLGSMSGFDSVEECYRDLAGHVFALETGLSSDPPMNWRVSTLDRYRLVSNSDAHSPPILGREASVFTTALDYFAMRRALETGEGYDGTVEFFPEEGKYHLDGHRTCGVRWEPAETRHHNGICSGCGKPVTVGVLHRVEALADREEGAAPPEGAARFRSLVPLPEIVGEIRGVGPKTKTVERDVAALVERLGPELAILGELPVEAVREAGGDVVAEAVDRLRRGRVIRDAGYDGEYGTIRMFEPEELARRTATAMLFELPAAVVENAEGHGASASPPTPERPQAGPPERPATAPVLDLRATGALADPADPSVLAGLDPEQRVAAEVAEGPLLVVAGPGTGKTRVLTYRIARLIAEGVAAAGECLALTFTRRAAEEMRDRLRALVPGAADAVTVTTFHGLGLRILKEQHEAAGLPPAFRVAEVDEDPGRPGTVTLDDLLALPVKLLEADSSLVEHYRRRYRWIAVDEYQDVDEVQYRLVRLLAPPDGNVCAIGDPDQAIYGFRGADVGFFLRFRQDFPGARVVGLARNYRSSPAIVHGALQAIAPGSLVEGRVLEAVGDHGAPARIAVHEAPTERAEAEFVVKTVDGLLGGFSHFSLDTGRVAGAGETALSFADIAVLFRTDAQADPVVEALDRAGVPYRRRGEEADDWDPRADRVSLLTLHAAKGLEFEVVFIVGCEDGLLPLRWGSSGPDADEERRLLFVGMTRARSHLHLCHARRRLWRGKVRDRSPSPFLRDIEELLLERRAPDFPRSPRPQGTQLQLL